MDHLHFDASLRFIHGHLRYNDAILAEAVRVRRLLFGAEPFLAVHLRRGIDRYARRLVPIRRSV